MKGKILSFILGIAAATVVFFFISNEVSNAFDTERKLLEDEIESLEFHVGALNVRRDAQVEITKELIQSDSLKAVEIALLKKKKPAEVQEAIDLPEDEAVALFTELTAPPNLERINVGLNQINIANGKMVELQFANQEVELLNEQVAINKEIINGKNAEIEILDETLETKDEIIQGKNGIIAVDEEEIKELKKKVRKRTVGGVVLTVLAVILI